MKLRSLRLPRRPTAFLHDVAMAAIAFFASLCLRLGLDFETWLTADAWFALTISLWCPAWFFPWAVSIGVSGVMRR